MKRYADYKNSGFDWIGEIPDGWNIGKVGFYYEVQLGKMLQPQQISQDDTYELYLCAVNIDKNGLRLDTVKEMWFSKAEKEQYKLSIGDLLVVEGGDVGLSTIYNGEIDNCYIQNALHRVRAKHLATNEYLCYWLSFLKSIGYMDLVCNKATIAHYTKDKFINSILLIPPFKEQQHIVEHLNQKTSAIDTLIADKQKLVDLLKEKRQAVISEAVTKGLDKTAKMKESDIEWIGEVPDAWEVKKFKYTVDLINVKVNISDETYIGLENIESYTGRHIITESNDIEGFSNAFNTGDILFGKLRPYLAKCIIADFNGVCSSELLIFRNFTGDKRYLHRLLLSRGVLEVVNSSTYGSKMPRASWDFIGQLFIPMPDIEEQQAISDYLDTKTSAIDSLITDITTQIEKLKEYRQSVISEAVTGKVAI